MLRALTVRNVVLIERLDLVFGRGLTVLTGETGAGKSILLDSLGLALGERAGPQLLRAGATEAAVSAAFELVAGHPVFALLEASGIEIEDELVLRRTLGPDGRSRAFVNDQPVGAALLRRVGALLVEIQGQHEQMGLADPATHRDLLDAAGVAAGLRRAVADTHAGWRRAADALIAAEAALAEAAREEAWLRASAAELRLLAPAPAEEETLAARRTSLQQGERRREAIEAARAELSPADRKRQAPAAALRAAARALARAVSGPVQADADAPGSDEAASLAVEAAAAIERAETALAEAEGLMSRLAAEADDDPRALDATEERLFALRAAGRKYAVPVGELAALATSFADRIAALDAGVDGLAALRAEADARRTGFEAACAALTEARGTAAGALERAVARELAPLKLERARFSVALAPREAADWDQDGAERVAFLIAANPGQPPGPLGRIASGGELSRLMLALRVVLSEGSPIGTLVFDEVDSGIGGATASAVGERLARVADRRQVLVVTHSPQVAARGDVHLAVEKRVERGRTSTEIASLDAPRRREEIARMLAGERITDAARAAASSLLGRLI